MHTLDLDAQAEEALRYAQGRQQQFVNDTTCAFDQPAQEIRICGGAELRDRQCGM